MSGWPVRHYTYDLNHARQYMTDCVFFRKDTPLYVQDVITDGSKWMIYGTYLTEPINLHFNDFDETITVKPFRLGYINLPNKVIKATRSPNRIFKCGLCAGSLYLSSILGRTSDHSRTDLITSPALANTLMGVFPSIRDRAADAMAFHNRYAVKDNSVLYYLWNEPIATLRNDEIEIQRPFSFLKEELEEVSGMLVVAERA